MSNPESTSSREYRVSTSPAEFYRALEILATRLSYVSDKPRLGSFALVNEEDGTILHISAATFGLLVAREWITPCLQVPGSWRVSDAGAIQYTNDYFYRLEVRADDSAAKGW